MFFSVSNTTGEKDFEEFYSDDEVRDVTAFESLGIIKNKLNVDVAKLIFFEKRIAEMQESLKWSKDELVELFQELIPNFKHLDRGKSLDTKM